MEENKHVPIEKMEVFRRYVEVADWVWKCVIAWPTLARDTVGKQLVRAIDSVGANLVEGDGRYSDTDALHFFIMARASARESCYWLERAVERALMTPEQGNSKITEIKAATQLLNRLISYRRTTRNIGYAKETTTKYEASLSDPFTAE